MVALFSGLEFAAGRDLERERASLNKPVHQIDTVSEARENGIL